MRPVKKILIALLLAFVMIQFIRPARNINGQASPADFTKVYRVPMGVQSVLQKACYDCHSNNTRYPWYTNIQPIGWIMARHIKNGKEQLNFNEFGDYTGRRRISKLKGIANQIRDGEMPLRSYKIMHKEARLSDTQKKFLIDWMNKTADSLQAE